MKFTHCSESILLANLVIQSRPPGHQKRKSVLLFEGKTDGRVYRKVVDDSICWLLPAGNRAIAEGALGILKANKQTGVLAIVDADTDHITKTQSSDPDLLFTHTRDLEGMLLERDVLRSVLIEFDVGNALGSRPEQIIIGSLVPLAFVKFIAKQQKWQVNSTQVQFGKFIDGSTFKCVQKRLCKHIADLTTTTGITALHYETELQRLTSAGHAPLKVIRGHDATEFLAWIIRRRSGLKVRNGAFINREYIESLLRAAYRPETFAKCELYTRIRAWEQINAPYRVLR